MEVPIAIVTDIQNIMYPENQLGRTGATCNEIVNNLPAIPFLPGNNFKSAPRKTFFYKILFFLNLFLLPAFFKRQAQQNVNYALYANNIYRLVKYINWLYYNNQGDFVTGKVGDTPLYDVREDFTSNKTVGIGQIVVKKTPSSSDT
jgi:hypothetical protein